MESASGRVIATNGAALRIAEGGTGEPALVFLHYWGGSPICRSRGGGMMSVAVPLDRLDERGESRKETEESQATGCRLSTRGFLLSTFSPLLSICRRQIEREKGDILHFWRMSPSAYRGDWTPLARIIQRAPTKQTS